MGVGRVGIGESISLSQEVNSQGQTVPFMGYELIFLDAARKDELEPVCEEVLKRFELPEQKLIAIFDDKEHQEFTVFTPELGKEFCGFFRWSLYGMRPCPQEITNRLWSNQDGKWHCDVFIYLRSRTCLSLIGMAITFAHELQHFMQYGFSRKVWQASHDLRKIVSGGCPWDFPDERDAMIVSRTTAEKVCGKNEVHRYADQQIELNRNPQKWEVFLGLGEPFNLLQETMPLVEGHREALKERFPLNGKERPDYEKEIWWE
jgi:hypothetical protein